MHEHVSTCTRTHACARNYARAHTHTHTHTHTHARARAHTHIRHENSRRTSARLPLIEITPCDDHDPCYLIVFHYFSMICYFSCNKWLSPTKNGYHTHTEDVHKLEREHKITQRSFKLYLSLADVLRLSVSHTLTHARRVRIHTSAYKHF